MRVECYDASSRAQRVIAPTQPPGRTSTPVVLQPLGRAAVMPLDAGRVGQPPRKDVPLNDAKPAQQSFIDKHHFLLRRLHSLSGIAPIGAFLIPHLTTNSSIVWGNLLGSSHLDPAALEAARVVAHPGVEMFQHEVNFIHGLPALLLIEIFVLWLPIAFHAGFGIVFARSGKSNLSHYGYEHNWRYMLQRLSGYLGVLFIFLHLASLRWGWTFGGLLPGFKADFAASTTAAHLQHNPFTAVFYMVCVLGLVYHFANGLWTAAITWGLTVTVPAQRRWGYVCTALGIGLAGMAAAAVVGFATLDVESARTIETMMVGDPVAAAAVADATDPAP